MYPLVLSRTVKKSTHLRIRPAVIQFMVIFCMGILVLLSGSRALAEQTETKQEKLDGALIAAIKRLDRKDVTNLLKKGADAKGASTLGLLLRLTDQHDDSAYYFNKRQSADHDVIAEALIRGGAEVDVSNPHGMSPLQHAASFGWHKTVRLLLNRGADPNIRNPYGGSTPLYFADAEATALLLKFGADPNIKEQPKVKGSMTALHYACLHQDAKRVRLLLEAGAETDAKTFYGETPLMMTFNVKVAQELLKHGANINAKDDLGRSVLYCIKHRWDYEPFKPKVPKDIVAFLIAHGAHESKGSGE